MHKRHRNLPARTAHLPESAEQRGKKSADFSEESARRRLIGRRRLSAGWFRLSVCAWRKRSGQSRCRPWTRTQRQRTHILDRHGRRAGRVEHERRLYLHMKFVRGDERVKRSGRQRFFLRWALRGQIVCRPQRSIPRRRTSALQRHRHIHTIELPGTKDELVGCLDLVSAIAEQFSNSRRSRVAGQRPYAGITLIVRTDGIVKFPRAREQDAEVRRDHGIRRSVESEVRLPARPCSC
jgi:hypothetical protein